MSALSVKRTDLKTRTNPVIREYAGIASKYDKRWANYTEATHRETLKRLNLESLGIVLDLGCGTGSFLKILAAASPFTKLVGADLSFEMIKIGRNKLAGDAFFVVTEAQQLPFRSESFDAVVSCNSFQYWRNPEEGLQEIVRVLRPKGRIIITDCCGDYVTCRFMDLFLHLLNRAHFKIYGQRACARLLQSSGLGDVMIERFKINWFWGVMTAKAKKNFEPRERNQNILSK